MSEHCCKAEVGSTRALASYYTSFPKILPHSLCCLGGNIGMVCASQLLITEWLALKLPITLTGCQVTSLNTTPSRSCSSCLTLSGCKFPGEG